MVYYCPLNDAKGNDLLLPKIRYADFPQLLDIDEGYKVEYKSAWDESLRKKHLAKVITSFANTEGGWLFIGVNNDGSLSEIDKARTDYGQQIGQIIKSQVSPYPRFETKFVANPDNKSRGILVVHIHEGDEPPYICQGTVYVRVGSNKEPVPASNRAEIDNLVEKRNRNKERIEKFCVNEVYPNELKFPYGMIFLFNRSDSLLKIEDMWTKKESAEKFAKEYGFDKWMITTKSVMFYNSRAISTNIVSTIIEMCLDGSVKIYLPLYTVPEVVKDGVKLGIAKRMNDVDLEGFTALDGYIVRNTAYTMLKNVFSFLLKSHAIMRDYILGIKLFNIRNCYMFYRTNGKEWSDFMCEEGFKYSNMDSAAIPYRTLMGVNLENMSLQIESYISQGIFSAFGMTPIDYLAMDDSVHQKIKASMGDIQKFSINEYHKNVYGL